MKEQPELSVESRQQIDKAISDGRKIEAIKLYREAAGVDLKEAKEAVEQIIADLGPSQPKPVKPSSGCLGVLCLSLLSVSLILALT